MCAHSVPLAFDTTVRRRPRAVIDRARDDAVGHESAQVALTVVLVEFGERRSGRVGERYARSGEDQVEEQPAGASSRW